MVAATRDCREGPASSGRKTLVLGLGNPLLTDDGVGLQVVQRLRPTLAGCTGVEVGEDFCGGLRLMERMIGFDRAIIVDAICSGAAPGTVRTLAVDDLPTRHSGSAHDADMGAALALGRQGGAALPAGDDIRIVAIEAEDVLTFGEECTPRVRASIPHAAEVVLAILAAWR